MRPANIIQLCYGIPGVFAYFAVIYGMYGVRRVLNTSFIVIFIVTAAVNISTWLNAWINLRLQNHPAFFPYFEWLNEHPIIGNIPGILISQFYYAQNVCVFLITMDRFAIIMSVSIDTLWWHRHYVKIAIVAQLLCLAMNLIARLPISGVYVYNNRTNRMIVQYDKTINYNLDRATYIQLAFGIGVFSVCSVLNVLSLNQLVKLRKMLSVKRVSKEVSFFLISFSIFLAQVLNILIMVCITIINAIDNGNHDPSRAFFHFIDDIMFFTSDLFSIGPAYYTLSLPSPIRRFFTRRIKIKIRHYAESSLTEYRTSS